MSIGTKLEQHYESAHASTINLLSRTNLPRRPHCPVTCARAPRIGGGVSLRWIIAEGGDGEGRRALVIQTDHVIKERVYGLARSTARMYSSFASVMAVSNASRRCAWKGNERGVVACQLDHGRKTDKRRGASQTCLCFLGLGGGKGLDEHFDLFCFDDQVVDELSLVCYI